MLAIGVNIFAKSLAVSKELPIFAVRRNHKVARQSSDYTYSADKAGLISGTSFGDNRCGSFARTGSGSAYSLLHTANFSTMRRNPENLTATANNSTRMSTANARKSVSSIPTAHPLFRITKKELIALIEGKICEPSISDTRYSLILSAFLEWVKCEDKGLYASDIRDNRLMSRLNAIREAFQPVNNQKR